MKQTLCAYELNKVVSAYDMHTIYTYRFITLSLPGNLLTQNIIANALKQLI